METDKCQLKLKTIGNLKTETNNKHQRRNDFCPTHSQCLWSFIRYVDDRRRTMGDRSLRGGQCNLMIDHEFEKRNILSFHLNDGEKTDSHSTTTKNSLSTQATAYSTDLYVILTQKADRYVQNILSNIVPARAKDIAPHW